MTKKYICVCALLFLCIGGAAGEAKENINALSALEFELKTKLYGRGRQFEQLQRTLGGYETLEQIIYLMKIPESIAGAMRGVFVCVPMADDGMESLDEDENIEEFMEFNLAQLDAARLEELPYITPLVAGRIARASKRGELTERWKLLTIAGVTPEIYAEIKKYFTQYAPKKDSQKILRHEMGYIAKPGAWSFRSTVETEGAVRVGLRGIFDNSERLASPRGWYASGDAVPPFARRLGIHVQFGNENFALLLGNFRFRSSLGLLAGRAGYGSGAFTWPGAKTALCLPQFSDSAKDTFTGASLAFSLPWLRAEAFFSARTLFTSAEKLIANRYQGTLRQLINKQESLADADTESVTELLFGANAQAALSRRCTLSATAAFPMYSCAFIRDKSASVMTGSSRWHGAFGFSFNEENFGFFGEGALAGDAGLEGTGEIQARALELGVRGKRARLRYALRYREGTHILPSIHDGLAGLAPDGRHIDIQNEWCILDSLRWQYAVNFFPESARSKYTTALRFKGLGLEIVLAGRLTQEESERQSAQYRCTVTWASGSLYSIKMDCGTRFEKGKGSWLSSSLLVPLGHFRVTLAYGLWQTDPKLHLWPSFPILISAGENNLGSYTGKGSMGIVKLEGNIFAQRIRYALKVALRDTLELTPFSGRYEASLASSLQYAL
ncbi:MAG: hypothetical protein LBC99_03145 [Spirochaetota bacterium]|jgi:hypothetical protein|nr:hypothetical protein [Spirochaetota bacterium]